MKGIKSKKIKSYLHYDTGVIFSEIETNNKM